MLKSCPMARSEQLCTPASYSIEQAFSDILKSRVNGFDQLALRTRERLESDECGFCFSERSCVLTDFDSMASSFKSQARFIPAIVINPQKTLNSPREEVSADLVRTLAVLDQYPQNGHERRLADVYKDALEKEKEWLLLTHSPSIKLDPREQNPEELVSQILGERSLFDVGFEDWQKAIDNLFLEVNPQEAEIIKAFRDHKNHFIAVRQINFSEQDPFLKTLEFRELNPNQRAQIIAGSLIRATLKFANKINPLNL